MMSMQLPLNSLQLSDLQDHMARLVEYYQSEITALGNAEPHVTGTALDFLHAQLQDRLERLDSADYLWTLLCRQ